MRTNTQFSVPEQSTQVSAKAVAIEPQKVWAETWNGRFAMIGLVAAACSDLLTGHMFFGLF